MDNTLIYFIQSRVTSSKNVAKEMSSEPLQRQKQISEAWSDPLISGALPSSCTAHHGSIAMSCFQLENIIFRLRSRFEFIPPKGNVSAKLAKLSGFSTKHNQNRFQVFACLYFGGKIVFQVTFLCCHRRWLLHLRDQTFPMKNLTTAARGLCHDQALCKFSMVDMKFVDVLHLRILA